MSDKPLFIDTNILVYAHDEEAGRKHTVARQRVAELWARALPPSLSIHVLQELYVNLVRKGASARVARETVEDYLKWNVIENDTRILLEAMRISERHHVSFWDAAIIAAAKSAGAKVIWSEDLSNGQEYEGVRVENPLQAGR